MRSARIAGLLLPFTVALLLSSACGKKGPPRPPPRLIPAEVTDLAVRQTGEALVLEMTYPAVTTGGLPLTGISALEVWALRLPIPAGGAPPPIEPRMFDAGAVPAKRLEESDVIAATRGARIEVQLPAAPVEPPTLVALSVRTLGPRRHASPHSNLARIVPRVSPAPPQSVAVEATAQGVAVRWTAGAPPAAGYDVLRRLPDGASFDERVAQTGPETTAHVDATAAFGNRYAYTVRTVAARDPLIESADGPLGEVEYADVFAPPTPTGLVALAEEGRIRLLWNRVEAADLARYRVHRSESGAAPLELPREPGTGVEHTDAEARPGVIYTYTVSAVDLAGNESAPSEPVTATSR